MVVLQTIVQHAAEAYQDRRKALTGVLGSIENKYLMSINWSTNPGNAIEALLHAAGLAWSQTGKKLWRRADPNGPLSGVPPAGSGTSSPTARAANCTKRRAAFFFLR